MNTCPYIVAAEIRELLALALDKFEYCISQDINHSGFYLEAEMCIKQADSLLYHSLVE